MTAEGTACNAAGEEPKAEFAAEKVAVAVAEDVAPAEREGEDVGGPFVMVNGDSDGLSDRGSDLGKAPDEDAPSEEDEAPGSNAALDAPEIEDHGHGAAAGEADASPAAPGISSADERDRADEEPKGGVDEGKCEPNADFGTAEVVQQDAAGVEEGGADPVVAVTCDGSDSSVLDSEVIITELTKEDSAAIDVSELEVDETAGAEQNAVNAPSESFGHDDALTKAESGSASIESEVHADGNREEHRPASEKEPVELSTTGPGDLVANGCCGDTKSDSFEAAAQPERHDDEIKFEHHSTDVVELVEQDDACGEQDVVVALQTNEPTMFSVSSDSITAASESEVHANGTEGHESDQLEEGATITEAEVEGVVKTAGTYRTGSVEDCLEEEVGADEFEKVEGEATCGILQVEEKMDKDGEGGLCDDFTGSVASNEEVNFTAAEGINDAVPSVDGLDKATEDTSHEVVEIDGLVKDGEAHLSIETDQEKNNIQVEIALVDETTAESDLKADSMGDVNTSAPLLSKKNFDSAAETLDDEHLESPDLDQPNEIENDVAEAEAMEDVGTKFSVAVPLQVPAAYSASSSNNEPQPPEFVDGGSFKHSSPPATELESCDHTHPEENRSREISDTTVDKFVSCASLEHGYTGQSELSSVTVDESQEKTSDSDVDQGEPVTLNTDELVVTDIDEPRSATGYESAGIDKVGDIPKNDDSIDTAGDSKFHEEQSETCNASTACDVAEDIDSENLNASSKSSDLVETKCLEEHEIDDKHAHGEETKVVEDASELRGLDKNNMGDAQVIGQQKVFMIKVPRFAGDDLWQNIQVAHSNLDKLTQERDAINIRKQKQKSVCDQYREKLEAARREEREARAAHGYKKNDLNSVRSVIGKLNQANSIEEIVETIAAKEMIVQHETISLKEEKLLIKEINDLKAQLKQLRSSMGSKAEINEAFDQKEHIHERQKTLKNDSDVLFTNLKSLEENTKKIQKAFEGERIVFRKLNDEYRAANERRQKAYSDWAELKAEPSKKNKYFFKYKEDREIAGGHLSRREVHELQLHCNNQVERVMEMWNKDEDFRKQYVEANKISTLRRLGTHDGRRLGPDEEPPVIPSRRPSNPSPSLAVSNPNVPTTTTVPAAPVSVPVKEGSFPVLPSPDISKRAKSKASGTTAQNEKITVTEIERDVKETEKERARLMEEELERAKKAEELVRIDEKLREEKAAAEKERLRLEQKAKAKEAEERKRRKAEKAQEKAEFKARKEAEMKEKKKAKKEKKKGPADSSTSGDGNDAALATADTDSNSSDNPRESDVPQPMAPKRISRPAAAIKQLNRLQPMPAPLRNRGKRKMRQYILIAAAVLSVLALFVAASYIPRLKSHHS